MANERERFSNNGDTTLDGGITDSDTSLVVASAASFPAAGRFRILIDAEIIIVDAPSGTTFGTLTRGAEGTAASAHSNGAVVRHILTAAVMDLLRPVFIRATSDESVANNTMQDDDQLALTVGADEIWQIDMFVIFSCAVATADSTLTFSVPSGGTLSWGTLGYILTATAVDGDMRAIARHQSLTANNMGVIAVGTAATPVWISGLYIGSSNAGAVQFRFAQNSTDGSNPLSRKSDSYLRAHRIA